jgi:hypothetical protein
LGAADRFGSALFFLEAPRGSSFTGFGLYNIALQPPAELWPVGCKGGFGSKELENGLDAMTSRRYITHMGNARRATIYLDPALHRALRLKAAQSDRTVSEIVNTAVKQTLAEDAADLAAFRTRAKEPNLDFETVLKDLRRRGKL